jgi:hypothetical protein
MSLIKKSDVKNHLSAHHRTEIHPAYPKSQSDGTGFPHEDPAGEDPKETDPVQNSLDIPTTSQPETVPIVACRSAKA